VSGKHWMILVTLLAAPLAGCLGSEAGDDASASADDATTNQTPGLPAPNWSIGDAWTYTGGGVGETTWVVTGEEGEDWIVDTTNRELAFIDARTDISFLGEVRKSDKAGSQGDTRVEFFDWPLVEDKTWTTTWDGVERTITVDRIEDGTAYLTATQNDRLAVEYTYDSKAGHFGQFAYYDANGTETASAELSNAQSGFEDSAVRWQLDTALDEAGTFEAQAFGFGFRVPENATDLWLDATITCETGNYDFQFGPSGDGPGSEESTYAISNSCSTDVDETGVVVDDPQPGAYRGGFTGSSVPDSGEYAFLLYVRTLQEIPVNADG
jgi:hypothetical protein